MKQQACRQTPFSATAGELHLSGQVLAELVRAMPARGLAIRFRAKGHSMAPFIRDGDVICVAPLAHGLPRVGEVVAFVHPETSRLVVHRITAQQGAAYVTRGDNVPGSADGVIPRDSVLGRVTEIRRNGRHVRFGLGLERVLIARLSQAGLLLPAERQVRRLWCLLHRWCG